MWTNPRRIFNLEDSPGRSNHAQVPTPWAMKDRIRIYYAGRNNGKSYPTYFDLSHDLKNILYVHSKPIMAGASPGMFDADGVMPSCVIERNGELWMYYIGWNELKNTARYQNEIGLAISKDGGETFQRKFMGPIMGRSAMEPGLAVMPFVIEDKGIFKMWYQSGTGWHFVDGQYEPTYVIKYADSINGIDWRRLPEPCINPEFPLEAFSRPCVIQDNYTWKMWVCTRDSKDYRGGEGSYQIERAESTNGKRFIRCRLSAPERGDWDSDMQCYPYVFEFNDKLYMLYNGNDFGQTGIGLAEWN